MPSFRSVLAVTVTGVVAVTSFAAPLSASAAPSNPSRPYIVQFAPGSDAAAEIAEARRGGVDVERGYFHAFPGYAAVLNDGQLRALRANPRVVAVEADGIVNASDVQLSPTWGLDRIDQRALPLSASYTYTPAVNAVNVYIIDTGLRSDTAELTGRTKPGYSAIADGLGTEDCNGHGTHVAGTVAGTKYGVAKNATVTPVRVLDCAGSGSWSGVIAGIDWAIANHVAGTPAVANMSLGGGISSAVDTAVANLVADGVSVAVAAGNDAIDACNASPARVPSAITVGATDSADRQASFSNFGSCLDVYAPGVDITSSWIGSPTAAATISGTSMASPHVAGLAALLLGTDKTLTPAQLATRIAADSTTNSVLGAGVGSPNRLLFLNQVFTTPTYTTPAAPSSLVAAGAKRSATLKWSITSDGGSALTGQTITVYSGSTNTVAGTVSVTGTARSATITGLSGGKTYSFTVRATNAAGTSANSARSNIVTVAK